MHCLIVADDLTGACDAAGPFAARGYVTTATINSSGAAPRHDVLAVSTDTRNAPASVLPFILKEFDHRLPYGAAGIVFKKIDSTLRGNAPAEIAAVAEVFGCPAIVTPAFPAMRRVVSAGHLSIAGQPDFVPIHLPSHFSPSAHVTSNNVLDVLRAGERIVTVDAITDDDLDRIVAAGLAFDAPLLWAGSAGLSSALARSLPSRESPVFPPHRPGPVVFCAGSDHPVTLNQQAALIAKALAVLLSAETAAPADLLGACARGENVILRIPHDRVVESQINRLLAKAPPLISALLVTGGDTASLLFRALGMQSIALHGEITAGIPYGSVEGGAFDGTPIVTKSGGFGSPGAFIEIADFFACPKT